MEMNIDTVESRVTQNKVTHTLKSIPIQGGRDRGQGKIESGKPAQKGWEMGLADRRTDLQSSCKRFCNLRKRSKVRLRTLVLKWKIDKMNSETDMTRSQFKLQLLICVGWVVEIYCNLIIFENEIETTINIWLQRKVVTRECLVTVKTEKWNSHTAIVHKAQEYLVKKSNLQRNLEMNNTISRCFIRFWFS